MSKVYERVICRDGFVMSVQAGEYLYSSPRRDTGPYSAVEIGYPSQTDALLLPFAEDNTSPTETVYPYVPAQVVFDVIFQHGGMVSGELPSLILREAKK
jgi:hypothetical protein